MEIFWAVHEWGGGKKIPLPKVFHTYTTIMKLDTAILT